MSSILALLLIILLSLADVIISLICLLHGNHQDRFSQSVYTYTFQDSLFDVWLCATLRCAVLIGASIGIVCNWRDAVKRVGRWRPAVFTLSIFMIFLTLAKLLVYNEYHDSMMDPWFWSMFSWSLLASCLFYGQWTILGRISSMPSQTPVLLIQSGEDQETLPNSSDCSDDCHSIKDEDDDENQSKRSLLRLLAYSKPDLGFISVAFIALVISSVAEIFQPLYIGKIIEGIVVLQDRSQFYHSILIMVSLAVIGAVAAGIRGIFFKVTMARLSFRINNLLFASIMKQEIGFFDTTRTGDITSRLTSDTATMSSTLSLNINVFLRNVVNMCGCVILMITLSWQLTIVSLAAIPVVAVMADYYGKYYEKLAEKVQDSLAKANSVAEEAISTMRTVRSFANEDREKQAYFKKLRVTFKLRCKEALVYGGFMLTNEFWDVVFIILTLLYGGHLVLIQAMSGGQLISFILYVEQLGQALQEIGNVYTGIMEASGASAQVFEFIDRQPKICQDGNLAPDDMKGRIEFNQVTFAYPSRPDINVLQDISFVISPGEMVALVGPSGGGKTSCVNLIQHFYEPQLGDVLLDGQPVKSFDHAFLHKTISMVGQEPVLYANSIKNNISYGLDECDQETIEDSAIKANAHQFIIQQPKGYETETGEKGIQLSGGQKQRVAIARALIRQPKVLLLDEATSALDAESEYEVQKALYREASKMTIVIIAHRLSTVEKADKIIVIDKGCVIEQGTHPQLVRAGGMYSELVQHQLLAVEQNGDHRGTVGS